MAPLPCEPLARRRATPHVSVSGSVLALRPRVNDMPHRAGSYVLVADANPAAREMRAAQLRAAGCEVMQARTGFEAIVKASCHLPDAIVIGTVSDMDPTEVVRLLTTSPATSHIPVLPASQPRPALRRARSRTHHVSV